MAVNQPMISDNQVENSWKLEVTNQVNNEETRVNALLSRIEQLESQMAVTPTNILDTYSITKEVELGTGNVTESLQYPLLEDSRLISWGIYINGRPQGRNIRCSYTDNGGVQDDPLGSNIIFTTGGPMAGTTSTRPINVDYSIPQAIGTYVDHTGVTNIGELRMSVAFLLQRI